MAHFAQLNESNIVTRVIVVSNEILLDNGIEKEKLGIEYCKNQYGKDTRWIQTSYTGKIRNKYAGIGDIYLKEYDAFISPKISDSWVFDEKTLSWVPPFDPPDTYHQYVWDESIKNWTCVF